ncbi:hypothetical protein RB653_006545 [Dictyostelium firmibasis]|uniref:MRH domain-containing protein n=1 Tax=Dictyostelium firmibasis TaxID=79012 RepID=A0AAN7TT90_9MYCE
MNSNKQLYILIFFLLVYKINSCLYSNPNDQTQKFDLSTLKLDSSAYYKAHFPISSYSKYDSNFFFNFCNGTITKCDSNLQMKSCQFFTETALLIPNNDAGNIAEGESYNFTNNGLTIEYRGKTFSPTASSDCSTAIEPNRRVTHYNIVCNKSIDTINVINDVTEDSRCSYQINIQSKLVCRSCPINCTELLHAVGCNEVTWKCLCDTQTFGDYCNQSRIYISSVDSTTTDGGTTFINGYFGNTTSERLSITIGSLQCNDIIVYNSSTINCKIDKGEGIKQVILTDRDLKCTGSFQYIKIQQPCPNDCFSFIKNGICNQNTGVCNCNQNYTGLDCGTKIQTDVPISIPSINDTTGTTTITNENSFYQIGIYSLVELNFNGSIVKEYILYEKWNKTSTSNNAKDNTTYFTQTIPSVNCTIEYSIEEVTIMKNYSFAGMNFILLPSSVKLKISIKDFLFSSTLNTLQLRIKSTFNQTMVKNDCNSNKLNFDTNDLTNNNNLNFITISKDSKTLYARFINKAISDGRVTTISNSMVGQDKDSIYVGLNLPHCVEHCEIDPDFGVLVDSKFKSSCDDNANSKPKWFLPVVIAGPIVGFSIILIVGAVLYKKYYISLKVLKVKLEEINK